MAQLDLVALRRDLHRHPELGYTEFRTAARVREVLAGLGTQVRFGADVLEPAARLGLPADDELEQAFEDAVSAGCDAGMLDPMRGGLTGVVAEIVGDAPGPTIGFRFDMDALPLVERPDPAHPPAALGFASARPGIMHACGHDGHVTIGLGLAERLATTRDFPGTVRLLFQPAEEGGRGAAAMAAAGVTDGLAALFCLHLGGGAPLGVINPASEGWLISNKLVARFTGRAAHAGTSPEQGRNALLAAAQSVLGLHALPPFGGHTTRVNVGQFVSGTAPNVIAADARLVFETRASTGAVNDELVRRCRHLLEHTAAAHEVQVEVECIGASAEIRNDARAGSLVGGAAATVQGLTVAAGGTTDASEDAGHLMAPVQAAGGVATYSTFGAGGTGPHHSPSFDIDEDCLRLGVDLLDAVARRALPELAPA